MANTASFRTPNTFIAHGCPQQGDDIDMHRCIPDVVNDRNAKPTFFVFGQSFCQSKKTSPDMTEIHVEAMGLSEEAFGMNFLKDRTVGLPEC